MFRFESPSQFWWLLVVAGFWALTIAGNYFAKLKLQKNLGARVTPFLTASVSLPKRRVKLILQILCLVLMVVALARPQSGQSSQKIRSEGVELIFLADVSESMLADDVQPNRLTQMRAEVSRLVDLMGGNKMGIVAFAGSATLLSPLTNDPGALKMYVDSLSPQSVSSQGTNFQAALAEADEAFHRGGASEDETTKVTRVFVIASDGEDQEPGAEELAKKLAAKGYRIFGLVYGTEKGATIPERDSLGFLKGYKKDRAGQVITTKVNGEAISALTQAGQGEAYFAVPGGHHLERLMAAVDHLEKTQFDSQMATQYDEKFQIFLLVTFILALLELALGERRSSFRFWRGRFEVPPA